MGWCLGGCDGLAKRGPPSARPFDGAPASADLRQGERPLPGTDARSGTGMVGERGGVGGVGWCLGGCDGLAKRGPPPARPFDGAPASADLRQGERPLPGTDARSGTGMVGERGGVGGWGGGGKVVQKHGGGIAFGGRSHACIKRGNRKP